MRRLTEKLRQMQPTWAILVPVMLAMIVLTIMIVGYIDRKRAEEAGRASERARLLFESEEKRDNLQLQLNNVGTDRDIVNSAARQGMTYSGSIRFTVLNPEALGKYTEAEYQRYIDEMSRLD